MNIKMTDFVIHFVNFAVLFLLLYLLLYRPVSKFLRERAEGISSAMDSIDCSRREAQEALAEAKKIKAAADVRAEEILRDAALRAYEAREMILEDAQKQAAALLREAQAEAAEFRRHAQREMFEETVLLAADIARQVLGRGATKADNETTVNEFADAELPLAEEFRQRARREAHEDIVALAVEMAEHILGRAVTKEDNKRVSEDFYEEH
ncbi:MAG: hypothetical protein ACOX8W_09875 [bacterium]|jgi:F-type H+-transporting ATPase subunit b